MVTDNILFKTGVFITVLGLVLALPNIDSIFIDFTQLGGDTIFLMRFGLVVIGLGYVFKGELF